MVSCLGMIMSLPRESGRVLGAADYEPILASDKVWVEELLMLPKTSPRRKKPLLWLWHCNSLGG